MAITIKDVAKEAGVAVETVSRVLNNRGYISDKTRKKVYDAMEKLDYTPNAFARGLSKKNMNCIAVIVPHVVHPYFAKVISQLEKEATKKNFAVFLYNSSGDEEKENRVLQLCQSSFVSGVLLFSADISKEILSQFKLPIIIVERDAVGGAYSIQCDNLEGGHIAARHLIEKGCKNMIVVGTNNTGDMPGDQRDEGFMAECNTAGLQCSVYRSTTENYNSMEYYDIIETALNEHPDCDGIFATSDLIASQVIQICKRRNISIPGQIKLVGFDDVNLSRLTSPTITTVRQPIHEIAVQAISMFEKINKKEKVPTTTILPVRLIEREST